MFCFIANFVCLFQNTLINLEMAVRVLIDTSSKSNVILSPEQLERQHKSKVRRLYDIANVFISIGLIEKVTGNLILKKPVFRYVGPIKLKKNIVKTPDLIMAAPITPLTEPSSHTRTPGCHVTVRRFRRKLEFTTPISNKEVKHGLATPPPTPLHKWDEILLVADMELTRINNGDMLWFYFTLRSSRT